MTPVTRIVTLYIVIKAPPHPGLVVREYLEGMAVSAAAAHLRTTRVTLSRLLNGKAGISANMALRLAAAFGTSPEFWMNMQTQYDLWRASRAKRPVVRRLSHEPAVPLNSVRDLHA